MNTVSSSAPRRRRGLGAWLALPFSLLSVILTVLLDRVADPVWRLLLVTGFLGGYTTFSSYSFELVTLIGGGRLGWAAAYLIASNLLGVAACAAGAVGGRELLLRL